MISISTAWNALRYTNAKKMISEIKSLGFDSIELNFTITKEMFEHIMLLVYEGFIKVASLHNYCPMPDGIGVEHASPDYYSLSATDEAERRFAVLYTKKTIDSARLVNAQAVVVHAGYVETKERIRSLANLYQMGKKGSKEYNDLIEMMKKERNIFCKRNLDRLLVSLDEVNLYAKEKQVKIGLENRYYYREMPSIDEFDVVFKEFKNSNLYYWHDTGHAQLYENLGLAQHKDFLKNYGKHLIGIHLHDIKGTDDHRAPLDGELDFSILKPYIKKDILLVMEPHYPATKKQVKNGFEFLSNFFKEASL